MLHGRGEKVGEHAGGMLGWEGTSVLWPQALKRGPVHALWHADRVVQTPPEVCRLFFLTVVITLSLPWAHALAQVPRRPFVRGALVGGIVGALSLALITALTVGPTPEYGLLRTAVAALLMGGPLGTLIGQGIVSMFVPPRERQVGAALGLVVGPLLGWPPLYLFPLMEHHLWQGPYWVTFWLASWAGWCGLGTAGLFMGTRSWQPVWKGALHVLLFALLIPAALVGARHRDDVRLHVTPVDTLQARHDVPGLLWKLDHKEELAAAATALGPLCNNGDERAVSRLAAVLDGTAPGLMGMDRSDEEYRLARSQAARSLGQIGGRPALAALLKNASEPDPLVRYAVMHALAATDDPLSRQALQKAASSDPDKDIRALALQSLHSGHSQPVPSHS